MTSTTAPMPERMPEQMPEQMPPRPPLPDVAPRVGVVEQAREGGPEVPVLAELADVADASDRLRARTVVLLTRVVRQPEVLDGLSPQVWLEQVCRCTDGEARRLLAAVDTLRHLPSVVTGLADGRLSWSQVQAIAGAARTVTVDQRAALDRLLADVLDEFRAYGPDELVDRAWQICDGWQPSRLERERAAAERGEFLSVTPRLFGGGSIYGEFGPEHLATIAEAVDTPLGPPVATDLDDPEGVEQALDELDERRRELARNHAADAAARLVQLCEDSLAGIRGDGQAVPPRPTAYVVTTADALLDLDRTPGWLLTTLAGGRMKATTDLVRQMLDQRGADLRGVVLDDCGQVVGVGRRTYRPPRWLREATWARDLVDQAPGSRTPVRRADLDHVVPFDEGGRTDVDNLQNVGRRPHNAKTNRDWAVTRTRDGTTTWTHTPTGLKIARPPTWRRLDHPPPTPGGAGPPS